MIHNDREMSRTAAKNALPRWPLPRPFRRNEAIPAIVIPESVVDIYFWELLVHEHEALENVEIIYRELTEAASRLNPWPAVLEDGCRKRIPGIHVRRTDRIHNVSPRANERLMEAIKQIDADQIFLATDCESTKRLLQRADNRLITNASRATACRISGSERGPRRIHRSRFAVREAVRDLYSLTSCTRIIREMYSTFSESAAILAGIDCETIA